MTTSGLVPALAVLASLSGALLIAGLVGMRARATADRADNVAPRDHARLHIGAWWIVAGVAAALGAATTMAMFAAISALALTSWFALAPAQPRDRALRLACYAAVPVQYLFVATRSFDPFVATLPLVATLGLPLLALRGRDTRDLLDRVTACGWGVLACVYCVSHAAAILMLDIPGFAGRNGLLIAFLVIVANADDLCRGVWAVVARRSMGVTQTGTPRIALGVAASALVAAVLGAAFAALTPFPPAVAAWSALLLGLLGALGRFVMSSIARERTDALPHGGASWHRWLGRPDAIAFAAPVFFHLLHALYGAERSGERHARPPMLCTAAACAPLAMVAVPLLAGCDRRSGPFPAGRRRDGDTRTRRFPTPTPGLSRRSTITTPGTSCASTTGTRTATARSTS